MKKFFKKSLMFILFFTIVLSITISAFFSSSISLKKKSENPYSVLKSPPTMSLREPKNVEEICENADVVFVGQIKEVMNPIEKQVELPENSAENILNEKYNNKNTSTVKVFPVKVEVIQSIKGKLQTKELITVIRSSVTVDYEPEMLKGNRMIFVADYNGYWDGYVVTHPHAGYFYVTDDEKVYPAHMSESFDKVSGNTLKTITRVMK